MEQRLVDAYVSTGRTLDDLVHAPDFETLFRQLGMEDTTEARHQVYKDFLRLRKSVRLPRRSLLLE